jgi:putative oxidoreductase
LDERHLPAKTEDAILLAGRFALGIIFVKSGFQKLLTLGAFAASLANRGIPSSATWALIGATVEFVGGLMIVTGFRTRAASLLMLAFLIAATGISHRFWDYADPAMRRNQESQFFKNLSMFGGYLLLFAVGGGRYSVDGWLRRSKRETPLPTSSAKQTRARRRTE